MGEFVLIDPLGVSHSYNASKVGFAPASGSEKVVFAEGGSGGENYFGSFLRQELTEYEDSTVTRLFTWAINSQPNLKSLSFPNLQFIDQWGLSNVGALTDVYFPELLSIYGSGMSNAPLSSDTVFPKCSYVGSNALNGGFSSNGIRYVGDIAYSATGNWSSSVCQLLPSTRVIGGHCFYNKSISGIQGIESVQYISPGAFYSVKLLAEASFPNCKRVWEGGFAKGAFELCLSLRSAYFPECSQIGGSTFAGCASLQSAYFPKCTSIGSYAFSGCKSLSDVTFSHLTSVGMYAFSGCYALPSADGVYYAGDWAVLRSTVVPSTVVLSEGTYGLVYGLFSGASSLVSITNMDNVGVIQTYAFRGTQLQGISAPACESVAYGAFSYASVMSFAYLPKVKYIPADAFYTCYALTSLTVDFSNITGISGYAFYRCSSLSIPFSLPQCSYISTGAFMNCGLTKIYAPLCNTYISATFSGCVNLSEAYLPNVPELSWAAFSSCPRLRRIYLSACDYIRSGAFSYNTAMSSLYLAGSSVCRITTNLPSAYWPKSVYVLASLYDEYITHSLWASMSSRLVSLTTEQMEEIAATF